MGGDEGVLRRNAEVRGARKAPVERIHTPLGEPSMGLSSLLVEEIFLEGKAFDLRKNPAVRAACLGDEAG